MREKIIKKINTLYIAYTLATVLLVILFFIFKNMFTNWMMFIVPVAIVMIIGGILINNYKQECDKRYITKSVIENNFVLAKINSANLIATVNESISLKNNLFEIDMTLITTELENIKVKIVDQFSSLQKTIPEGYVYVTYDGNADSVLIIPTFVVQKYATNEDKIVNYEKNVKKLNYLNVLYNGGLIVETFEESYKRQQEFKTK